MIEVELPDGTIVEFPEGTSPDVMRSALQRRFGAGQQAEAPAGPSEPQIEGDTLVPPAPGPDGYQPTPQPTLDQRVGGAIESVRRPIEAFNTGFTNMFMLGGMDELRGGIDAAMTDRSYGDAVADARDEMQGLREDHPVLSTAGGIAGAVTSPVSQAAMRAFPASGSLGRQMVVGGGTGASLGAGQGFMEGEGGVGDRATNALIGSAFGGVLGAAAPALFAGIGAAYRGGRNALAEYRGIGQAADDLGISRSSGRLLSDTLGMDDPARMRAAISDAGPEAMLADAGPSAQGALDAVIQSPGEGARTALRRIDDRVSLAGGRLNTALDDALTGQTVGAPSTRQFSDTARMQGDLRAATAPARKAVYDRAYSQPIDYSGAEGAALLDDITPRLPSDAISYANKLMRMNGNQSQQIMASVADDGTVAFTRPPDVRQWDYIKQALDGLAESGDGAGALGGQTRMGSAYQGLARDIRRNLGQAVPEYDYAVNTAGDIIGQVRAIKTGETLLRPQVTRAEAEALLDGMSQAEQSAVKRGLRQSIDDAVANVKAVASDPNMDAREAYKSYTMLTSRASQDKMKLLLGEQWTPLKKALDESASSLGLRARVATNSRTFGRQQFGQMLDESLQPGRIASGEVMGPFATPRGIWQSITGSTPAQIQRARGSVQNELADVLTRPNPLSALNALEAARAAHPINPLAGRALTNALNAFGLGSVPATAPALRERIFPR